MARINSMYRWPPDQVGRVVLFWFACYDWPLVTSFPGCRSTSAHRPNATRHGTLLALQVPETPHRLAASEKQSDPTLLLAKRRVLSRVDFLPCNYFSAAKPDTKGCRRMGIG